METFRPRNAGPGAWKRWLREALALTRRNLFSNVLSGLAGTALLIGVALLDNAAFLAVFLFFLPPAALIWYIRTAYHGDRVIPVFFSSRVSTRRLWTITLAAITPYIVLFTIFSIVVLFAKCCFGLLYFFGLIDPPASTIDLLLLDQIDPGAPVSTWTSLGLVILLPMICWLFSTALFAFWFLLPLSLFHDMPLRMAWSLSADANLINDGCSTSLSGATMYVLPLLVFLIGIVAFIVVMPILGALMYVSYRDVFLGRADNLPVVTSSRDYSHYKTVGLF